MMIKTPDIELRSQMFGHGQEYSSFPEIFEFQCADFSFNKSTQDDI